MHADAPYQAQFWNTIILTSVPSNENKKANFQSQPLPPPKLETRWEKFAMKKGIKAKTAEKRNKMVYNEETGEWQPKWGYKGANKNGEDAWIVEVDPKKEAERMAEGKGKEQRNDSRRDRVERVKRNERLQRRNERTGKKTNTIK